MAERPPDVPLIVTPPGGAGAAGGALTTSRRAASARGSMRGSRDELPPSTWRSSVRVRDTGFRGSRKSVVRLEPPCNGLNGLPAIGKEVIRVLACVYCVLHLKTCCLKATSKLRYNLFTFLIRLLYTVKILQIFDWDKLI